MNKQQDEQAIEVGDIVNITSGKWDNHQGDVVSINKGWYEVAILGFDLSVKCRLKHLVSLELPKEIKLEDDAEDAEDAEDEESDPRAMTNVLGKYRDAYVDSMSISGNKTKHNGDVLAMALEGLTPKEVLCMAETLLDFNQGELVERYAHLNKGQQRMNGGNRLRAALKRGDLTAEQINDYKERK